MVIQLVPASTRTDHDLQLHKRISLPSGPIERNRPESFGQIPLANGLILGFDVRQLEYLRVVLLIQSIVDGPKPCLLHILGGRTWRGRWLPTLALLPAHGGPGLAWSSNGSRWREAAASPRVVPSPDDGCAKVPSAGYALVLIIVTCCTSRTVVFILLEYYYYY